MRHVSRTHRVALDWLFDRINLDPKIQIKYIDTKNQLADILNKVNFTFVHRQKGFFLSVYVDDVKFAGKKQIIDAMWKLLNKEVGLGEPTSFLDHVHLGCAQRQCQISKDIVDNYRTMFESRSSAGGTEKLPYFENLRFLHGLMIWKVMQRNVWNDIVS